MEIEKTVPPMSVDPNMPATLTDDQAAQVAGGLSINGFIGAPHICCLTCASYGRPLFSAVAAAMAT